MRPVLAFGKQSSTYPRKGSQKSFQITHVIILFVGFIATHFINKRLPNDIMTRYSRTLAFLFNFVCAYINVTNNLGINYVIMKILNWYAIIDCFIIIFHKL